MLSCQELVERTSALVDGELGLRDRLQVRVHLAMCHRCRTFANLFSGLGRAIAGLPLPRDDEAAVERTTARVLVDVTRLRPAGQDRSNLPHPDEDVPGSGR